MNAKIVRIHYRCNSSGPDANLKGQAEIGEAITLVVIMGELPLLPRIERWLHGTS